MRATSAGRPSRPGRRSRRGRSAAGRGRRRCGRSRRAGAPAARCGPPAATSRRPRVRPARRRGPTGGRAGHRVIVPGAAIGPTARRPIGPSSPHSPAATRRRTRYWLSGSREPLTPQHRDLGEPTCTCRPPAAVPTRLGLLAGVAALTAVTARRAGGHAERRPRARARSTAVHHEQGQVDQGQGRPAPVRRPRLLPELAAPRRGTGSIRLWDAGTQWARHLPDRRTAPNWTRLDAVVAEAHANGTEVTLVLGADAAVRRRGPDVDPATDRHARPGHVHRPTSAP